MKIGYIWIFLVSIFLLSGCNAPSAPIGTDNHKSSSLNEATVDMFTLFRYTNNTHNGDNITTRDNTGKKY